MPAFKTSAATVSACLAASVFFTPVFCSAASLIVNKEQPLNISASPGFSYVVSGSNGSLSAQTDGFLFCANIGAPAATAVTLVPQHTQWAVPIAQDVNSVTYNAGVLSVNTNQSTTLTCHAVGGGGELITSLSEGLFRNSYESKTIEQYNNLINWVPSLGFSWSNPVWSAVPIDPCNPSASDPAQVDEDVTCAAATGLRPAGASEARAGTLWTGTDGANFFYIARVDARYGPQNGAPAMVAPQIFRGNQPQGSGTATLQVVDAYSRGVAGQGGGYLSDAGTWCILTSLPAALNTNMCSGAADSGTLNGPLTSIGFAVGVPPLGLPSTSFFIGFIRPVVGAPPPLTSPAVAVSILVEPDVVAAGGDKFKGDDVIFGFLPTSNGFPWMTGGQ